MIRRRSLRQTWWGLEVLGTTLAGFAAAGALGVAASREGWGARVVPIALAAVALLLVFLLVRTRPRRWRIGRAG